jgi:hypothetical protein
MPSAVSKVAVGAPGGGHSPVGVDTVGAPELDPELPAPELDPAPELEPAFVPEVDPPPWLDAPELDPPAEPDELPPTEASWPLASTGVVLIPVGSEHDRPRPTRIDIDAMPSANRMGAFRKESSSLMVARSCSTSGTLGVAGSAESREHGQYRGELDRRQIDRDCGRPWRGKAGVPKHAYRETFLLLGAIVVDATERKSLLANRPVKRG